MFSFPFPVGRGTIFPGIIPRRGPTVRRIAVIGFLLAATRLLATDPAPRLDADGIPLPAEALRRFGSARFLTDMVSQVAFSPDGKAVFVSGYFQPTAGNTTVVTVAAWELATGKRLWNVEETKWYFENLVADPDGKHLWATGFGRAPQLNQPLLRVKLSARTGQVIEAKELFARRGTSDLHPTGLLAWERYDDAAGDISMPITTPAGTELARLEPDGYWPRTIRFAPDGKTVFVCGDKFQGGGQRLHAVDATTGKVNWAIDCGQTDRLIASPDGKTVVAQCRGGPVADPRLAAKVTGSTLYAWDSATGKEVGKVPMDWLPYGMSTHPTSSRSDGVRFAPDGKTVLTMSLGSKTVPIDAATWKAGDPRDDRAAYSTFTPDGKSYVFASGRNLQLFAAATHKPLPQSPPVLGYNRNYSTQVALEVSRDESTLTRTGRGPEVVTWAVETGKEVTRETPDPSVLSPDGKFRLRPATETGWEVASVDGNTVVALGQSRPTDRCRFSADGKFVVVAALNGVRIWDARKGGDPALVPPQGRGAGVIDNLRFDPTQPRAAVIEARPLEQRGKAEIVGFYDLAAAKRAGEIGIPGQIESWQFTPAGRLLVLSTFAQRPGKSVLTALPSGASDAVQLELDSAGRSLAVSPDERTVAVGGVTGIHLYDLRTGARRHTFAGLTRPPEALAFSPTGRYLASESADGPVLLWDVRGELSALPEPAAAQLWADLESDDAAKAFQAVRTVAAHPAKLLPLLKAKVVDRKQPSADEIAARVAKLGAKEFAERDAAEKELRAMGTVAHPALKAALAGTPTPELSTRATRLLAVAVTPPARLASRLVEAVEWAGGKDLLTAWAASDWPELTAAAAIARKRLQ